MQYLTREILAWCLILLGAFFLAKSIVDKGPRWTVKELIGVRIDKLRAFRRRTVQRLEAAFGFVFVLAGVSIHLYILVRKGLDAAGPREAYGTVAEWVGGTVVAMVVLAFVFHHVCQWVSRRSFVETVGYLVVRYRHRLEDDQELLKDLGEILRVEHRPDDTVESYAGRVAAAMGLEDVRERLRRRHKQVELG